MYWHLFKCCYQFILSVHYYHKQIEYIAIKVIHNIVFGFRFIKEHSTSTEERLNINTMLWKMFLNIVCHLALISNSSENHFKTLKKIFFLPSLKKENKKTEPHARQSPPHHITKGLNDTPS